MSPDPRLPADNVIGLPVRRRADGLKVSSVHAHSVTHPWRGRLGHAPAWYGETVITLVIHHERMTYDPDASEPKWRQITAILRARIDDGTYPPGRPLPSIAYLSQEYAVARNTARRVLDALVDEGLAYTEPGKGTYVRHRE